MSRTVCALLCAVAFIQPAGSVAMAAEQGAAAPSARSLDCARRYNDAMHMEDTLAGLMKGMLPMLIEQERQRSGATFTGPQQQSMAEAVMESTSAMAPELMDSLVPTMAASFTESELCALADFYGSRDGQSIIAKMPEFTAASMDAMKGFIPQFQQDMMTRYCRKIGCDAAKRSTAQPS